MREYWSSTSSLVVVLDLFNNTYQPYSGVFNALISDKSFGQLLEI